MATVAVPPPPSHPTNQPTTLPAPFNSSPSRLQLITQGAEALLYRTTFLSPTQPAALKYRPSKPYRHPTLDKRLTRQRILAEARVLVKCRRDGVRNVPAVLGLDWEAGWVCLEWITGGTVKSKILGRRDKRRADGGGSGVKDGENEWEGDGELMGLLRAVGMAVGKIHGIGVVHGDLTTSNLMLRPRTGEEGKEASSLDGEIVLIDFGLATQSTADEDRAVDLYVLERAFGSTHPEVEGAFSEVLKGYGESYKGAKVVLKRLEEVRMRGRKKSMIG